MSAIIRYKLTCYLRTEHGPVLEQRDRECSLAACDIVAARVHLERAERARAQDAVVVLIGDTERRRRDARSIAVREEVFEGRGDEGAVSRREDVTLRVWVGRVALGRRQGEDAAAAIGAAVSTGEVERLVRGRHGPTYVDEDVGGHAQHTGEGDVAVVIGFELHLPLEAATLDEEGCLVGERHVALSPQPTLDVRTAAVSKVLGLFPVDYLPVLRHVVAVPGGEGKV